MSRRTLADFKYSIAAREQATRKAEKTLAALQAAEAAVEAAMSAHAEAVAVLDATESTFETVLGFVVKDFGGRAYE